MLSKNETISLGEIERIVAGQHHDPHSVLGAHPGPDGVTIRALRPLASRSDRRAARRQQATRCTHLHQGVFEVTVPGSAGSVRDYRLEVRYVNGEPAAAGRPLPAPADARRARPAPDRRGQARAAVARARRAAVARPAPRSPSGRRTRAASGWSATSTSGTGGRTRCGRSAGPGYGSCSCPASRPAPGYKFSICGPDGVWRDKADPMATYAELPPATALGRVPVGLRVGRRRMAGRARRAAAADQPDVRLRGAPRLVAARPVLPRARRSSWPPTSPTSGSPTWSSCRSPSIRSAARGGTRSPPTTRRPRGSAPPTTSGSSSTPCTRRASASSSTGCPRTSRATRGRWPSSTAPPVRALRPPAGRAPRLGHAGVQLRPLRGAELPRRQRHLLARGVPHRRAAGRRGRVDALPGLLAQGGRVGAQRARRPGEPGRDLVPAGGQRHLLQAGARDHDDRRGVDRLAGRLAAGAPGRPRVRLQVEHGLDERHARVHGASTRSTGSTTTTS